MATMFSVTTIIGLSLPGVERFDVLGAIIVSALVIVPLLGVRLWYKFHPSKDSHSSHE